MPIILAIETSSELASCALLRGDAIIWRESSGVRTHSQSILPMVQSVLAEAGVTLQQCDAIAFGAGPGSFTGVRTACGIAQGLAFGAGLPVLPMVTLPAMAQACYERTGALDVLAVLDARMGEVYWAQYHHDGSSWQTVVAPALCAPGEVRPQGAPQACGNGFSVYAAAFEGHSLAAAALADVMPHAVQIARLAKAEFEAGAGVPAAAAQPIYLRNKIAFTSLERREINAAKAALQAVQ